MLTKIEWADAVWNPTSGCSKVSAGCANCYAERMAKRLAGRCGYPEDNPFRVTLHPDKLDLPLRWRKPRRVFVNSMSDLFHPEVPFDFIRAVWARMATARHHTFLILTKRPGRMKEFFQWMATQDFKVEPYLLHVWLGVSAENQAAADERIPLLLQTPAAVRFVSAEPLLGPICIPHYLGGKFLTEYEKATGRVTGLDWIIAGGETGPGARPMHPDWLRSLRDQCQASGVPYFFKAWGEWWPGEKGRLYRAETVDWSDGQPMCRVGKKAAGRLLDGREWEEYPEVKTHA